MIIRFTNNLTKNTIELSEIEDKKKSSMFFTFDITLPEGVDEGEYTYELIDEGRVIANGLLQIGDYERDTDVNKEYKEEKKGFIVYGQ